MSDPNVQNEIIEALKMNPEDIPFQDSLPPEESPLNYPVADRHFEDPSREEEPAKEVDKAHATMMAEVILGAANNIIEVGSGFFIKIKTEPAFHEYEELIQVIEEQNQRNIKRLILDEGDKAMLRPLLAEVLKARQKVLSPEHQLLIAGGSILIKKAQMVMEVRAENQILTERIRNIIQEETNRTPEPMTYQPPVFEPELKTQEPVMSPETREPELKNTGNLEPEEVEKESENVTGTIEPELNSEGKPQLNRQERRKEERKNRKAVRGSEKSLSEDSSEKQEIRVNGQT